MMKLTNIAAAFLLGTFLPVIRSYKYCSFGGRRTLSSELPFEFEFEAGNDDDVAVSVSDLFEEDTEWEDSDSDIVPVPFLSRRRTTTEQMLTVTLSEQCIEALSKEDEDDEMLTESEEEEMEAMKESIQRKGCEVYSAIPNITDSVDIVVDYSNCMEELASARASCEEADDDSGGKFVDLPAHQMICTAYVPVLRQLTFHMDFQNASSCIPQSCHNNSSASDDDNDPSPTTWTIADMELIQEQGLLTCGCGYKKVTCTMVSLEGAELLELKQPPPPSGGASIAAEIATTQQEEEVNSELEQPLSGGPIAAETTQEEVESGAATTTSRFFSSTFVGLFIATVMALF